MSDKGERVAFFSGFFPLSLPRGLPRPGVLGLFQKPQILAKRLRMWPPSQTSYFLRTRRVKKLPA